ncbi:Hypothetical predicted protein [Paramuricea clavata]|uniref:Uncharacterized protein n=1 Tax=Paramuricea clavata TaxID=317549 RepID=A0A6S7JA25_PARCT|nr:Hypothetical predicted protein [Paramuricea clavata]
MAETEARATLVTELIRYIEEEEALKAFLKTSQKLLSEAKEDLGMNIIEEVSNNVMTGIGDTLKASSTTQTNIRGRQQRNETVPAGETKKIDNNVGTAFEAVTVISDSILSKKVANEKDVLLASKNLEASLRRSSSESMNGSSVKFSPANDAQINFPTAFDPKSLGGGDVVDVVVK